MHWPREPEHLIAMKVQAMRDAPEHTCRILQTSPICCGSRAWIETRCAPTSSASASGRNGVSWSERTDTHYLDLDLDVPTTAQDVDALRELRRQTPSWFSLTPEALEALLPKDALDCRPPMRSDATPFTLPRRD